MGKEELKYYDGMYYDRVMSDDIANLLSGKYQWIIDFVKGRKDLDFQTGSNKQTSWVSIYRGTSRIFRIVDNLKGIIYIDAAQKYLELEKDLYDNPSSQLFSSLIEKIKTYKSPEGKSVGKNTLARYFDNHREGYHQNNISRKYGICGKPETEFIVVDKEAVIGFKNDEIRKTKLDEFSLPYKEISRKILAANESRFPSKLGNANFGNECDFIVLTKSGELILMELKDYQDTQKIYLSPFQISMYCDIFNRYDEESKGAFRETILAMVKQKQELGLLNPLWTVPEKITKISAALVVGFKGENDQLSETAIKNYKIVRNYVSGYDIEIYFTKGNSGELKGVSI